MPVRAENVGIKAIEIYIPSRCIKQDDLEKFMGVSPGKFTKGLGQTKMSFCDDREDMYSLALTAVSSLMRKYDIDPMSIGRLEVGTETLMDKSKSCKSVLMQLFPNGDIEGVDTYNACYGGTNALFNAVNWVESSAWDGRDAIVVAGDIALYAEPSARPTGGAGCVAMLVGPDAPLVLEQGTRASFMKHTYDFYKADFSAEYPIIDGKHSIDCYLEALDACYRTYQAKKKASESTLGHGTIQNGVHANGAHANGTHTKGAVTNGASANGTHTNGTSSNGTLHANGTHTNGALHTNGTAAAPPPLPLDTFDYMVFHAPTCKLVAKSYARLLHNDHLAQPTHPAFSAIASQLENSSDPAWTRARETAFMGLSAERFAARVAPGTVVPANCGNMYTASVYGGLAGLVGSVAGGELMGKRIGVFSYGSGMASSMFGVRVRGQVAGMAERLAIGERLEARRVVRVEEYEKACALREESYQKPGREPAGDVESLLPGTYYLAHVDEKFQRTYQVR
ncbi:hydroxymethylglutaryl-synthase [Diplodia corticola]|uniref:Hydroxymethylglutaryl-CoA synthase n=1 Tax=Diplodia corticola TaxID=236234 RepID=A0A1J9R4X9_9PEZI|nr:hydroxymethylglutaryl-synthase [Diplodia corticola]OJD36534.1 hydroxymethylglutaryl-synthase [Diplodia corticola]